MKFSDRIIIIDDKAHSEDLNTFKLLTELSHEQRPFIDYEFAISDFWRIEANGERILLLKDFSQYEYVFIHDSFKDPIIEERVKPLVAEKISKTSTVVFFSGSKKDSGIPIKLKFDEKLFPDLNVYEILRRNYYKGLANFIDSKIVLGNYDLKYLYNPALNPFRAKAVLLLEKIRIKMEVSLDTAVLSEELKELLLMKYSIEQVPDILTRFRGMGDDAFLEAIMYHIKNL
ncbi:hypothetical protein BH11BAC2_BH11BAC2_06250 [soil metagenome]